MHTKTYHPPACYGSVAGPRRQPVKRRAKPGACAVAGAVPPSVHTTLTSCTHEADPSWAHTFRDQVAAELFPFWPTRANRIASCGRGAVLIECKPCGAPHFVPLRCGGRTCPTCAPRGAAALADRTAARVSLHDLVMETTPWDGPGKPQRRSWRMLTLTTPAAPNLEDRFSRAEQRRQVKRARAAWGPFWRSTVWGKQVRSPGDRSKRARKDTSFAMGGESSPRGMVHLHVAVYGEYVSQRQLQALWGDALGVQAPVLDVRTVKGAGGIAAALREILKYVTKGEKGPRQAAHAASVEAAWRGVRRLEVGGALRRIRLPETKSDGAEDVQQEDLHSKAVASCEVCGTKGAWIWLGIMSASFVQENGGFGLAIDYRPPPEIRPNRIVQTALPVARGVEFAYR